MISGLSSVWSRCTRAALLMALVAVPASAQYVTPDVCELTLDPGVLQQVGLTVCVPGVDVNKADIFLLADNTASMGTVIASIQAGAAFLTSTLLNQPGVDLRIGVGRYTDVPPFVPNPFELQRSITGDETSIIDAINDWTFAAGGDVAESQFYAMHRLCVDPAVGWRPDAKRIIVWFGDSPAHDPICKEIPQLYGEAPVAITEASLTAELVASGPFGGTTVIAISTPFSINVPDALNNDPLGPNGIFAQDYSLLGCEQNGTAGQAARITAATQGLDTSISDPQAIIDAILAAIESILTEVTITLVPFGDIVPFVSALLPPEITVQVPGDEEDEACVQFTVAFEGQACLENTHIFEGGIDVLVNGNPVATKQVVIVQPGCEDVICTMFLGLESASIKLPGGATNDYLLLQPVASWPVLLDSVPKFHIPNNPVLEGMPVYFQVGMSNWFDFPSDPIKVSHGLRVVLGQGSQNYGQASGMQIFLKQPPLLGGVLEPGFSIDGL